MSFRSLTTALTLYRGGALTLDEAAAQHNVSTSKLATACRSRGITIREADRATLGDDGRSGRTT